MDQTLETPEIVGSSYTSNTTGLLNLNAYMRDHRDMGTRRIPPSSFQIEHNVEIGNEKENTMSAQRRIVQVFIVDPNENVPLDKALLYKGEMKFTDATDQELFFEIGIKTILDQHNEFRKTVLDEQATQNAGRDVFLKEARIRDLKMSIVNVATF